MRYRFRIKLAGNGSSRVADLVRAYIKENYQFRPVHRLTLFLGPQESQGLRPWLKVTRHEVVGSLAHGDPLLPELIEGWAEEAHIEVLTQ